MGEYPLILFTVLSQTAAGAAITLAMLDNRTDQLDKAAGKRAALAVFVLTAVSLGISLLHVGHPFNVYRAMSNLGSSWLSREALLFSLLAALLLVYYFQWKEERTRALRRTLGWLIAATAVLAVIASGMIYVLPAVPAWNNLSPVVFFLFTGAVLGPLFTLVLVRPAATSATGLMRLTGILLLASLLCFILYLSLLLSGSGAAASAGMNMLADGVFWLRVVLNWILPLGVLGWLTLKNNPINTKAVLSVFSLVLVGELLGRYLFYYSAVILKVAGL